MENNLKAFLDMIAHSEGTENSPATKNSGYDCIVTGISGIPEIFTDYSDHPFANGRAPKQVNHNGLFSTASGRLQVLLHWWEAYKKILNLPDFSSDSQDAVAIQQIKERGALPDIESGDIPAAIAKCNNIWASLAGAGYGQHENSLASLLAAYTAAGGLSS